MSKRKDRGFSRASSAFALRPGFRPAKRAEIEARAKENQDRLAREAAEVEGFRKEYGADLNASIAKGPQVQKLAAMSELDNLRAALVEQLRALEQSRRLQEPSNPWPEYLAPKPERKVPASELKALRRQSKVPRIVQTDPQLARELIGRILLALDPPGGVKPHELEQHERDYLVTALRLIHFGENPARALFLTRGRGQTDKTLSVRNLLIYNRVCEALKDGEPLRLAHSQAGTEYGLSVETIANNCEAIEARIPDLKGHREALEKEADKRFKRSKKRRK